MLSPRYLSLLSFILLSLIVYPSHAQNSPQDYVNTHNAARSQVRVPNIAWDNNLQSYAQSYVNSRLGDCNLVHSNGPYGENLAKGSGEFTGAAAVDLWVKEKPNYDYNSNSCVGGECLHYTQVVWRNSARVGCARARCNNGWWFFFCNYGPPANYRNQRLY
ncbi:basic form of pathogenesis-related protein 1-like [Tripterygium wilfordii]|uniref:basic form of pathogenesis-related protein 1-like n=1 Tax=Tripterygium wilfordii TaxID=458696 RepID=UPI0018F7EF06|nr:basic form of pathogenesis-related protein 1-like [Tripterygium wilfordii]